jgi:hypothetical protein
MFLRDRETGSRCHSAPATRVLADSQALPNASRVCGDIPVRHSRDISGARRLKDVALLG